MKITITNYRGIRQGIIRLANTITVVGADNGDGKSSTAQALAAGLTGDPLPFGREIPKAQAGRLIRAGAASGSVMVEREAGTSRISWPDCVYKTEGVPVVISPVAAGVKDIIHDMTSKERVKLISSLTEAEPTYDDLVTALDRIGVASYAEKLWELIDGSDWDNAHATAKDKGAKLKMRWEVTTGERKWGTKKAADWMPPQWDSDLETADVADLTRAVAVAREIYEAAVKGQGVAEHNETDLREKAGRKPAAIAALEAATTKRIELTDGLRTTRELHDKLPLPEAPQTKPCPYCKKQIAVIGDELAKAHAITPTEIETMRTRKKAASKSLKSVSAKHDQSVRDEVAAMAVLDECKAAEKTLATLTDHKPVDAADVDKARVDLDRATERQEAYNVAAEAKRLHYDIEKNQGIVSILAPDGLRREKLGEGIGIINEHLRTVCSWAGWAVVELDQQCHASYDGIPYVLLAESEQYRVERSLQIATAIIEQAAIVIIDRADTLLKKLRNGLVTACLKSKIQTVVMVAMNSRDEMPDMSTIGGAGYWIAGNTIEEA